MTTTTRTAKESIMPELTVSQIKENTFATADLLAQIINVHLGLVAGVSGESFVVSDEDDIFRAVWIEIKCKSRSECKKARTYCHAFMPSTGFAPSYKHSETYARSFKSKKHLPVLAMIRFVVG